MHGWRNTENTNGNVYIFIRISLSSWQCHVLYISDKSAKDGKSKSNDLYQQDVLDVLFSRFHCWFDTRFLTVQIKRKEVCARYIKFHKCKMIENKF